MITKANNTVLDLSDIDQILDMGGNRITNVADPVLATDVATRNFVDTQSFVPIDGSVGMSGNLDMGGNRIVSVGDPTGAQNAVNLQFLQANAAAQGYLNDPTITRDNTDTFTVGVFQVAPKGAVTPFATTTSSTTRQLTNLFLRASGQNGIDFAQGAFTVLALTTQADISFGTGPDRITSGSGTPFSTFSSGDKVIVAGSASNDGTYDVTAATATTIDTAQTLTIEALGASVSIYRVEQDLTYHMFAVLETGVGTIDVAIDDNVSGSNIGSDVSTGWEVVRRLWSFVLNSSSDIEDFNKTGNYCEWVNAISDFTTTSQTLQNPQVRVPTGLSVVAQINVQSSLLFPAINGLVGVVAVSSGLLASGNLASAGGQAAMFATTTIQQSGANSANLPRSNSIIAVSTDTGGLIWTDSIHTGTTLTYGINTLGYWDERII